MINDYRIIDNLTKKKCSGDRLKLNDNESKYSQIYLTYDQKDKLKTKYILQINDLENLSNLTEFFKDILWYKKLNQKNLMILKDCFLIDTKFYLIKPYALFGSCDDLLNSNPYGISEQLIAHIIWQILQAIRYLHDRHIMHRAIASKDIYLCGDGRILLDNFSHCISMISPFDGKLRRQIYDYSDKLKDQILYLAPEVIYQNTNGYNLKSDIYSLGTVACELANGSHAYSDMSYGNLSMLYAKLQGSEPILLDQTRMITLNNSNNKSYIEEIKKRKYTKEFHLFIKSCLSIRLDLRSSANELQTHSFFKYQKKFYHNQNLLFNDTVKLLEIYKKKSSITTEFKNLEQIFNDSTIESTQKSNVSWDF